MCFNYNCIQLQVILFRSLQELAADQRERSKLERVQSRRAHL